jgi:hypothetical protein
MHGRLKRNKIRRRNAIANWTITIVAAVLTFLLLVAADSRGISKKWVTAIMGTLGPFSFLIYAYRGRLLRWSFWASLTICLTVHCVVVWVFFRYVLINFQTFSIWFWLPVMFIEAIVLLVAVKRIEEKFTGQHETIKLSP